MWAHWIHIFIMKDFRKTSILYKTDELPFSQVNYLRLFLFLSKIAQYNLAIIWFVAVVGDQRVVYNPCLWRRTLNMCCRLLWLSLINCLWWHFIEFFSYEFKCSHSLINPRLKKDNESFSTLIDDKFLNDSILIANAIHFTYSILYVLLCLYVLLILLTRCQTWRRNLSKAKDLILLLTLAY